MESTISASHAPVATWQETLWWLLTISIFLSWWAFFARRYAREFSLSERLLAAFTGLISQIIAITFIAGWTGQLSWWPIFIANAVIVVFLCVLAWKGSGHTFGYEIGRSVGTFWRLMTSSTSLFIITVAGLLGAIWVIYLGQLLPPFCFDAWGYHYGWVAMAYQDGHLGPFPYPNPHLNFYPKNTEMLFLWWVIGAGTERWANIVQAGFGFTAAISFFLLARRVGARRKDAFLTGMLIFSIPTVLHQMWMGMVDLSFASAVLMTMAFLSRKRLTWSTMVLAGCLTGFFIGTKGTGVYSFIGIFLFILYRFFPLGYDGLKLRPLKRLSTGFLMLLVFGIFSTAFGSYFYIRNWVSEGNPTGAWRVKVGEQIIFRGERGVAEFFGSSSLPGRLWEALEEGSEWPIVMDGFFDPQEGFAQGTRIGGWGSPWTVLMLPAIPIAILWALIKRRWKVLALILAFAIPYFLFSYNHTWTRFILPVIGAGPVAFGFVYSRAVRTKPGKYLLPVAAILMVGSMFIGSIHDLTRIGLVEAARKVPYPDNDRYALFHGWGDEYFSIAIQTVTEPGTKLGYAHMLPDAKILALWNPGFTNEAIWLPWRNDGPGWEQSLRDAGVDAVYVGRDSNPMEYARGNPGVFIPLYEGDQGGVYRLVKNDGVE